VILRDAGYEVSVAGTLGEARELAAHEPPDGAILDLLLPDGNGVELCAALRSWSRMPILTLSALDAEDEKVKALDAGADDYLTKPFSASELLARLDATFRRVASHAQEASVCVAELEINFAAHSVRRKGRRCASRPLSSGC
jgi:two-component system, OmpR family, KDP operon response regulator KdpE